MSEKINVSMPDGTIEYMKAQGWNPAKYASEVVADSLKKYEKSGKNSSGIKLPDFAWKKWGWTEEEEELILSGRYSNEELAKMLNRTVRAITERKRLLKSEGKKVHKTIRPWTEEEMRLLLSDMPNKEVAERTGRTECAVVSRRSTLRKSGGTYKRKAWTQEEVQELLEWTGTMAEFAKAHGRNYDSVVVKVMSLKEKGEKIRVKTRKWTPEEEAAARNWTGTISEFARIYGKTYHSVQERMNKEQARTYKKWTPEEEQELMEWTGTISEFAKAHGRTYDSVNTRYLELEKAKPKKE